MPPQVIELVRDLLRAGFEEVWGGGKGSHCKFTHPSYSGQGQ